MGWLAAMAGRGTAWFSGISEAKKELCGTLRMRVRESEETGPRELVGWRKSWSGLGGVSHTGDVRQSAWELSCGGAGVSVANICL